MNSQSADRTGGYFFDMKHKRMIRYLSVKDGNVNVAYTDDFIKMMKNEYDYFFDTSDHLFDWKEERKKERTLQEDKETELRLSFFHSPHTKRQVLYSQMSAV